MKAIISMLVVAAALLLAGCKGLESQLVGTWKGPSNENMTLKEDKSFELGAGPQALAGKWSVQDDKTVKVEVTTLAGKPVEEGMNELMKMAAAFMSKDKLEQQKKQRLEWLKSLSLAYDKDKKTLTMTGPNGTGVTFTKEGS